MRIKEFSIRRYGPLPDIGHVALGNFSLIYGQNEHGKTLTIEALIKLLLQQLSSQRLKDLFRNIDRVDENPDGYLIVEDESGEETKIPGKGDLTDIVELSPQECRNIFIIRNSDLSIALESEFYRNVTDRLTGLRTEEISKIKKQLQEVGKLTNPSSAATLRDVADEKLKTNKEKAEKLITEIEVLEEEIVQQEFDTLEEQLFTTKEQTNEVNLRIGTLEDARKRENYEKSNKAYLSLTSARENLEELGIYNSADAELWVRCEGDINNWTKQMKSLQSEVNAEKGELEQKRKALDEKKLKYQTLNARKQRIDDEIKPAINSYEMGFRKVKREETRSGFYKVAAITSAALLSLSMLGIIMNPSPLFYGLLAAFLISTAVFAWLKFSFTREKAHFSAVFEGIKLDASRFELAAETIEEILLNVQRLDEEYAKEQDEIEEAEKKVFYSESQIKRWTETDIPNIERQSSGARETIEGLIQKSKTKSLEEYRQKLDLKSTYEKSISTQIGILKNLLGSKGEDIQENISYWHDKIDALKDYENKAKEISYDEKAISDLEGREQELQIKKRQLEEKLSHFQEQLRKIEREANEILQPKDSHLCCTTSVDLNVIRNELLTFINRIETEEDNAVKAITIFEEMEREEEEKISTLFGEDSPISQHLSEITGGVYQEVEFAQDETKRIEVKLEDGSMLDAEQLSGSTYDQLYLSIRLALGEKLLKGNKGFFIMDDPFIKADKERLQRQIDILNRISKSGWQIIYFTAKDEVKDALKHDIENGNVSYIELPSIPPHQNLSLGSTSEFTSPPKIEAQTNQGELPL